MKRQDFYFDLPSELIAKYPHQKRAESRLLVFDRRAKKSTHQTFHHILDYLKPNDLLVMNNTKVMKARLFAKKKTGGKVELLVERISSDQSFIAHMRANKSLKIGDSCLIDEQMIEVTGRSDNLFCCRLHGPKTIYQLMSAFGHMPLPPYIDREDEAFDEERYQTVYADKLGAVAAPTAGLHFDDELLKRIQQKGVAIGFLTLHVGAGTFQPVKVDDILSHQMHSEYLTVGERLITQIKQAKKNGGRVFAVGTTVVRSLETIASKGALKPFSGDTDIFIYPGFKFKCVDAIITNFHLPESTLIMLVAAFIGVEKAQEIYQQAINKKYRFYSYGDASLLL